MMTPEALVIYLATALPALSDAARVTYELLLALAQGLGAPTTPPLTLPALAERRGRSVRSVQRHLRELLAAGLIREERAAAEAAERCEPAPEPAHGDGPRPRVWWLRHAPVSPPAPAATAAAAEATTAGAVPPHAPAVSALLQRAGVYQGVAQRLARSPWVTPDLAAAWERHLRADRRVRSVPAMLTYTLESPERCLPAPQAVARDAGPPGRGRPLPRVSAATRQAWRRTLRLLEARLGSRAMGLGLAASQPVAYDGQVLVVAVPTAGAAELLSMEHGAALEAAAREALGRAVRVRLAPAKEGQLRA